jgi:phosphate transport system substrate-binding protein
VLRKGRQRLGKQARVHPNTERGALVCLRLAAAPMTSVLIVSALMTPMLMIPALAAPGLSALTAAQPTPPVPQATLSLPEAPMLVVGSTPLWTGAASTSATRNTLLPTEYAFRELYSGRADLVLGTLPPPAPPIGIDHPLSVPVGVFAISVAYSLPNLKLRLDVPTLCRLLSGQISSWNAPEVSRLNPGAVLPALPVLVSARTARNGVSLAVAGACVQAGVWPVSQLKANWSGGAAFGRATLGAQRTDLNLPGALALFALQSTPQGSQVASLQAAGGEFVAPKSELGRGELGRGELGRSELGQSELGRTSLGGADSDRSVFQPFSVLPASDIPQAYPLRGLVWASLMPEQAYRGRSLERAQTLLRLIAELRTGSGRGVSGLPQSAWTTPRLRYQGQRIPD